MSKGEKSNKGLFRIIRAVIFGVVLYVFLSYSPILFLKMNGIKIAQPQQQIDDDPVYHDKNGKRITVHEYNENNAYQKAEKDDIKSHAECKELYPAPNQGFQRTGCDKYVTEQKHFPSHIKQGNWIGGKTTAECEAEVNAYWEPILQDMREKGEDQAADSWGRRNYGPELHECQNYDNVRISKVVYEPISRIDAIIKKLEQGGSVTEEDNETITKDRQLVSSFPENEYTKQYSFKLDRFFKLASTSK
jgi:hypothetical protein